jgi:hypothetical protein
MMTTIESDEGSVYQMLRQSLKDIDNGALLLSLVLSLIPGIAAS